VQAIGASLQKVWRPVVTNIRLIKAPVWPVAMYGCESCTLQENEEKHLEVFEMKGLRRIQRVSWTAKKQMSGF